ncbi:MAG: hypothetical protein KKC03_13175 [Bacteroidetes bacterium]|nr:hypothetical protein [Bacteroidota bacterium]
MDKIFGRINKDGNVDVLWADEGEPVTRLDEHCGGVTLARVWPVNSTVSAYYEHPKGLVLTMEDARKIGLEIED